MCQAIVEIKALPGSPCEARGLLRFPAQSAQSVPAWAASASHKPCVEPFISKQQYSGYTANMSDKKQTVDLGLLEEDDEFEEFPAEGK